ncbi:hypothetical protein [Sphingopyxis sp. 2PD]|jgi:hypothetical protein|uniref:hypothetical protein n=1 Tax=Sphingopyxis sp. 2PD TaxID=2502196 RepID=UPI0014855ACC|nr:hypothetical protein [Sphingopyxis sp. 2PD]
MNRAAQNDIASVSIALAAAPQARQFRRWRGSDSGQIRRATVVIAQQFHRKAVWP